MGDDRRKVPGDIPVCLSNRRRELASIHSWKENVFLTSLLSDNPRATLTWLGAEGCVKDQTNCTWLDGSVWDFDNWGPTDPYGEECVFMGCVDHGCEGSDLGLWYDGVCEY